MRLSKRFAESQIKISKHDRLVTRDIYMSYRCIGKLDGANFDLKHLHNTINYIRHEVLIFNILTHTKAIFKKNIT